MGMIALTWEWVIVVIWEWMIATWPIMCLMYTLYSLWVDDLIDVVKYNLWSQWSMWTLHVLKVGPTWHIMWHASCHSIDRSWQGEYPLADSNLPITDNYRHTHICTHTNTHTYWQHTSSYNHYNQRLAHIHWISTYTSKAGLYTGAVLMSVRTQISHCTATVLMPLRTQTSLCTGAVLMPVRTDLTLGQYWCQ